jgi:pimeloyl-ACP methyl ester carboxylesterase
VIGLIWLDTYKELGSGRSPQSVDEFVSHLQDNFVDSTRSLVRSMFVPSSDPALIERVAKNMSSAPPEIALPAVYSSFSYSRQMVASLDEVKLPVIAINPDNARTDIESMSRHGVEVVVMPGVGHLMMMEDPPRLNALLDTAIDRLNR